MHSPFAFDLITKLLRSPESYYDLHSHLSLLEERKCHKDVVRFHSLVFRLIMRFRPEEIIVLGDVDGSVNEVVKLAVANLGNDKVKIPFFICNGGNDDIELLSKAAGECAEYVALLDISGKTNMWEAKIRNLISSMRYGMSFASRQRLLIVADRNLPLHHFTLRYR